MLFSFFKVSTWRKFQPFGPRKSLLCPSSPIPSAARRGYDVTKLWRHCQLRPCQASWRTACEPYDVGGRLLLQMLVWWSSRGADCFKGNNFVIHCSLCLSLFLSVCVWVNLCICLSICLSLSRLLYPSLPPSEDLSKIKNLQFGIRCFDQFDIVAQNQWQS